MSDSPADGRGAPYKIVKRGGRFHVLNNFGESKADFATRDAALEYQRALYANVPGAGKKADKTKFSGKAPKPPWAREKSVDTPIVMHVDGEEKYPISDQHSANSAWKLRGHGKGVSEEQVVAHIRRACNALGLKFPGDGAEKSALTPTPTTVPAAPVKTPIGTKPAKPKAEMKSPIYTSPPKGTPAHQFVQSGSFAGCLICGAPPEHPIHDPNELNAERPGAKALVQERLAHGSPPYGVPGERLVDPSAAAAGEPVEQRGCMVALFPDPAMAKQLAVTGGESADDLHVTLAFLPDFDVNSPEIHKLLASVSGFARSQKPLAGEINGDGRFMGSHKGGDAHIVNVDVPDLTDFRTRLVRILSANGFKIATNHGFSPHMTLSYGDAPAPLGAKVPLQFDYLSVASGSQRWHFMLGSPTENDGKEMASDDLQQAVLNLLKAASGLDKPSPEDAAKVAAGIDAGVDQSIVLLRSCNNDTLPPYAQQARDVLQGIEPACDVLLDYFGLSDPDDNDDDSTPETASKKPKKPKKHKHKFVSHQRLGLRPGTAGWYGPGLCAACGRPADDPDHDGDVDAPGVPDADSEHASERVKRWADELALTSREPIRLLEGTSASMDDPHMQEKAFVTTVADKTILTGPASSLHPEWAASASPNKYMRWMQGRLVGAEKPNRNGAMWSTAGLQLGQPTVNYGPLNWLHEQRHIIGTLADSRVVTRDVAQDQDLDEPFIAALAAIYAWVCPEEMAVIDMASDSGRLWYSMECVGSSISCAGDAGCGAEFAYMDVMRERANVCEHLATKTSARLINNPTFLGAAVIVPPVRPGWASADARLMSQVASLAELSAENMPTDMSATEWEALMGQVVRYAVGV